MKKVSLKVVAGALTVVPIQPLDDKRSRWRTWMAVIARDPKSPGGLARQFMPRARGDYYYIVENNIKLFDPIEFGADYVKGSRRTTRRWYGVVVDVEPNAITLVPVEDSNEAFEVAAKLRGNQSGELTKLTRKIELEVAGVANETNRE